MIGIMELIVLLLLISLPLFLIALVDILKHDFPGNDKLVWILVVIFFPLIGSILYLIIGKKARIQKPAAG
ncbi:MAG: PLD nuclease N-terminal domain-containing protein [Candidatus Saccharicenans sp.]|nr:PLD nuclease N-terminal domain-containing protein [Candidatus Saccharicenans sp.]